MLKVTGFGSFQISLLLPVLGVGVGLVRILVWMCSWGCFARILGGGGGSGWAEKYDGGVQGLLDFG